MHHRASAISWYRNWHSKRYAHHVHVGILVVYVLSVFFTAFILPNQSFAALTEQSKTITSEAEFNQGTLVDTKTSGNQLELKPDVMDSLSNSSGGAWQYRKPITINNSGSELLDYQVSINSEDGVAVNYNMDESTGTTVFDSGPNSLNGTVTGTSITTGKYGNGRLMNSSNGYINTANNAALSISNNVSMEFWANPTAYPTGYANHIVAKWTSTADANYVLYFFGNTAGGDYGKIRMYANAGGVWKAVSDAYALSLNQWQHICWTYNSSLGGQLFINGNPIGSRIGGGSLAASTASLRIGFSNSESYFPGRLDNFKLYSKALTQSEISANYSDYIWSRAKVDFSDIRFTDSDGKTEIPYWIESLNNNTNGIKNYKIWTKVPSVSTGNKTIYIYYGNSSASFASDCLTNPNAKANCPTRTFVDYEGWQNFSSNYERYRTNNTSTYNGYSWQNTNISGQGACQVGFLRTDAASLTGANSFGYPYGVTGCWDWGGSGGTAQIFKTVNYGAPMRFEVSARNNHTSHIARFYVGSTYTTLNSSSLNRFTLTRNTNVVNEQLKMYTQEGPASEPMSSVVWHWWAARKYAATEPTASLGIEESAPSGYLTPGSYTSPSDTNVLDMNWIGSGSWLTATKNFKANVAIPQNTSISFSARVGYNNGAGITWDNSVGWQSLGTAEYDALNPTYEYIDSANLWDNLPSDLGGQNWRYVQVKADFTSDSNNTPVLHDYTINYGTDITEPTNPTSATAHKAPDKAEGITNNSWTNEVTPYFEWTGASDEVGGSGLDCYYAYFGLDDTADPETAGLETSGAKCHSSSSIDLSATDTNPLSGATSGQTYYLRVDTRDKAGNVVDMPNGQALITYKFDNTPPTSPTAAQKSPVGYTSTNSYSFNWTDFVGADDFSDISHYQYKTGGEGAIWTDIVGTSFANQALNPIANGQNTLYIRAVDNAGNASNDLNDWYRDFFYYSANAPSEPQSLTVTPNSSTTNSFNFSWSKPLTYNEGVKGYRYSVNAVPTANNTVYLSATGDTISTGNIPAATNQGLNTFYVVAIDTIDNVNYASYASVQFEANTAAPSAPLSPQAVDSSNRATEDWSITVKWQAPEFGEVSRYHVYRSVDQSNWVKVAETGSSSLGYIDTNLNQGVDYYYKIHATDNAASMSIASSIVSKAPTGKYTVPPAVVSGPEVEATAVGAIITWSTDRAASSFVEYSTDTSYKQSNGSLTPATTHRVVLSGLNPSTGYNFRVQSLDEERDYAPSEAYSRNFTFATSAAPGISEVEVSDVGLTSAIVTWKTTSAATSSVKYGTSTTYGTEVKNQSGSAVTTHTIRLPNLNHSTVYNFKITGTDIDGNYMESDNYVFTTLTYPRISNVRFEQQKDTATSTLKVTWSSNVPLTSVVKFGQADGGGTKETSSSKLVTSHEMIVSNLKDNTDYIMIAEGRDAYGNLAVSDSNRVQTDFDTRPPEIFNVTTEVEIQGFGIEAKGQIVVSWETDEPATSQIEYAIGSSGGYTNRTQEDTSLTTSHVVIISDLKTSSPYHFRVNSSDASKNQGYSDDYAILTSQASNSVLDIILQAINASIGWLFS